MIRALCKIESRVKGTLLRWAGWLLDPQKKTRKAKKEKGALWESGKGVSAVKAYDHSLEMTVPVMESGAHFRTSGCSIFHSEGGVAW